MDQKQNTKGATRKGKKGSANIICTLCKRGELWDMCDEYIVSCSPPEGSDTKSKRRARFPNLAGLCRYLGTGLESIRLFREQYPDSYDRLLAIFEDEALNSDVSTTLLSSYMKKRLSFSLEDEPKSQKEAEREVYYCFEHDVYADGE